MNKDLKYCMSVEKGERKYVLSMPVGSPLGECYDACHEFLSEIAKLSQEAVVKATQQPEQEAPVVPDIE